MRGWGVCVLAATLASGCGSGKGGSDGGDGGGPDTEPVPLDPSAYTYRLTESPGDLALWTTPATHRLTVGDRPPEGESSGLFLSAARGEFEPVQLALGPASGRVTLELADFPDLGGDARLELLRVEYESGIAERLVPIASGDELELDADAPVALWLSLRVPDDAPAGDHETTLTVTPDGGEPIAVPVRLYVFDFTLPPEIHYATQLNVDVSGLADAHGSVDAAKTWLLEHRFTPKSVTWPSGFGWGISWDNDRSSDPCEVLWDEPDEPEQFSIGWLSRRYILGEGWGGVGFPNAMLFQFVDNGTPRPGSLCGIDRGDHFGSDAFNAEWSQWLGALQGYLDDAGMLDKAYYYVQNEPQNDEDHALAAHLCRLTKAAAPDFRIAISEEPKPEIAEDPGGACGYDIWIAHIPAYESGYADERRRDFDEEVWWYSLDQDADPYFNPTALQNQGMHARVIPWASWAQRIGGWAYYDFGRFVAGDRATVRGELFREGFEDYEYLWLANGQQGPEVGASEDVDPTVIGIASSATSWNKSPDQLMVLRHELGRFIEGTRDSLPVLDADEGGRPRGSYFINFQDPQGAPTADPLVIDGETYMKVGWQAWSDDDGLGWYGENVGNAGIALYGYDEVGGVPETQRSYLFDDYGRPSVFEFALASGRYEVTVGVGHPSRGYPGDPHQATLEGAVIVDDEPTSDAEPTIVRTTTVDLSDGLLTLEVGGRSPSTGEFAYTFVSFMTVVPVD